jgi:hypothetical protein
MASKIRDKMESGKVERYSASYWLSELTRSETDHDKFKTAAEQSIKIYTGAQQMEGCSRGLSLWWAHVNTMLPAFYSSTPKVEADLRKKSGNPMHTAGARFLERVTQFNLDEEQEIDEAGYNAVLQFMLTGRAVLWARYESEV